MISLQSEYSWIFSPTPKGQTWIHSHKKYQSLKMFSNLRISQYGCLSDKMTKLFKKPKATMHYWKIKSNHYFPMKSMIVILFLCSLQTKYWINQISQYIIFYILHDMKITWNFDISHPNQLLNTGSWTDIHLGDLCLI